MASDVADDLVALEEVEGAQIDGLAVQLEPQAGGVAPAHEELLRGGEGGPGPDGDMGVGEGNVPAVDTVQTVEAGGTGG